jgi:hypothetical protein
MSSVPITWIRVSPGKFIRADANVLMVDSVQSERPGEGAGLPPCEPPVVELSRGSGPQTDVHGIAPSATSEIPCPNSLVEDQGRDEPAALGDAEDSLVFNAGATLQPAWHGLTSEGSRLARWFSRGRLIRVSRWTGRAAPNAVRATSRRLGMPMLASRTSAASRFLANVRARQAEQRAFGRLLHVHRTVCCRSPPSARQFEAEASSSGWVFHRISIASP